MSKIASGRPLSGFSLKITIMRPLCTIFRYLTYARLCAFRYPHMPSIAPLNLHGRVIWPKEPSTGFSVIVFLAQNLKMVDYSLQFFVSGPISIYPDFSSVVSRVACGGSYLVLAANNIYGDICTRFFFNFYFLSVSGYVSSSTLICPQLRLSICVGALYDPMNLP